MANPQIENGYTKIANEIVSALSRIRIPGESMQCLLFIIRKTYGFNKKEDLISISQFYEATGIAKSSIIRALNKLLKMKIIYKKVNGVVPSYCLNKDYEQWKPVYKKVNVYHKVNGCLPKGKKTVYHKVTHKRQYKETITKERVAHFKNSVFAFNNYPLEMLKEFVDYWIEPNKSGSKVRFEMEKTWDLSRRLRTWYNNDIKWGKIKKPIDRDEILKGLK